MPKAAPAPEYDRYAPVPAWSAPTSFDLTLPSKQVVLVRKIGMEEVVDLGLVEAMDTFKDIVGKGEAAAAKAKKGKKATEEDVDETLGKAIMKDKAKFKSILALADKVTVATVLKPSIRFPEAGPDGRALSFGEREDGHVWVDQIPFDDKLHIFTQIFEGMGDLEPFRDKSGESVADVPAVRDVPLPTVGDASA